jgi:hypothetical protein
VGAASQGLRVGQGMYQPDQGWLALIGAVTSHGPVNPRRVRELMLIFEGTTAGLVFVTAFEHRSSFARCAAQFSRETEVRAALGLSPKRCQPPTTASGSGGLCYGARCTS